MTAERRAPVPTRRSAAQAALNVLNLGPHMTDYAVALLRQAERTAEVRALLATQREGEAREVLERWVDGDTP